MTCVDTPHWVGISTVGGASVSVGVVTWTCPISDPASSEGEQEECTHLLEDIGLMQTKPLIVPHLFV